MTSNPLRILQTLDRHLQRPFVLHVYGRSALALGFLDAPPVMHVTMDVDGILPVKDILEIEANDDFWRALELTNAELAERGLYVTHLFEDRQVILAPDWLERRVSVEVSGLKKLRIFRPSTEDLILTKMMRVDPQDRDDILFLLSCGDCHADHLKRMLEIAMVPEVPEIVEAFSENKKWLASRI